ncbi:M48 family metalloprotease [Desulfococcus sp.]|uniref:M48 family metalloprotease n=1 Tax=Desulfococcus sp. TaxID=2025834 RepID=UPI0035937E28
MSTLKKHLGIWMAVILAVHAFLAGPARAITIQEEETLGKEFLKLATRHYRVIHDPAVARYVDAVGRRILKQLPPQPFSYRFFVIQQEVYNAFAGPAGNIFIHSGLIEAMDNEDELAGILAHEITHVQARHISHRIELASKIQWATLAGMVAGIFLGIGGAGEAGSALTLGSVAATQSAFLAYSRQDEMQADELGINTLTAAGYSGAGMLTMLKKIRDKQWFGSSDVPSYLMTHPAVDDRLAYLDTWIQGHPDALKLLAKRDNTEFIRVRTRLTAGYGDSTAALRKMTAAVEASPDDPMIRHGYGIALARNSQPKEGLRQVRKALEKNPFDAVMLKDMGEIAFMDGQYEAARAALEGSKGIDPNDFETFFLLGRTQLELEENAQAADTLRTVLEKQPDYVQAFKYLGEAYGKEGRMGDAHYYLGRYYHDRGDMKTAAFHLRQVIKHSQDPRQKAEAEEMLSAARKEEMAAKEEEEESSTVRTPRPRQRTRAAPFSSGQNGRTAW